MPARDNASVVSLRYLNGRERSMTERPLPALDADARLWSRR